MMDMSDEIKKEYLKNKETWLTQHGFDVDERLTYIYFPENSYEIKDKLKADGFKFDKTLMWHTNQVTPEYADKLIEVDFDDIAQFSAWGEARYLPIATSLIQSKLKEARPHVTRGYIGDIGSKFDSLPVVIHNMHITSTKWGTTNVVEFLSGENKITWFTTTSLSCCTVGDTVLLSGTIKGHDEFRGEPVTIVTRCKIK